jgi:serine/threonine-protein kinase
MEMFMSFNVGESVGPYRITEQLGQGGMATVFKAYHPALDRYVALKVLHPAFLEDPNFQARFQREARLVARLEHPNIVPIYDFAEHEKRPYLVMKFIEGETLKARLSRGPLPAADVLGTVESVGSALYYAHKQGILHRDVKPSNVLMAKDGQIYLADFGLARIAEAGESTLSSDMIMGTPQYISPEQAIGKGGLDEGTDIYSFGVMIYELIVGRVPFSADTPFSIIHDHIYSPLPMPRSVNPNVPEGVERVLLKALAKERADRYPDVLAMVDAFKQAWVESGIPDQDPTLSVPGRTQPVSASVTRVATPAATSSTAATMAAPTTPTSTLVGTGTPAPTVIGTSTPPGELPPTSSQIRRRRRPWKIFAMTVLLLICCVFGFLILRNSKGGPPMRGGAQSPTGTGPAEAQETPLVPTRTPAPAATLPPAIQQALDHANQNPDDPQAQLDLSFAYWDAGDRASAYVAISNSISKAGRDRDFFVGAGGQCYDRQIWVCATEMYLNAVYFTPQSDKSMKPLHERLSESAYAAAKEKELPIYITFDMMGKIDEPVMLVTQARYEYYYGSRDNAIQLLGELKKRKPNMYEGRLLEAEIMIEEKRYEEARPILEKLQADLNTPKWIALMAGALSLYLP